MCPEPSARRPCSQHALAAYGPPHVVNPLADRRRYETFSFLPPLTDAEISRQVDYIVQNGWTPCLEVSPEETSSTRDVFANRMSCTTACYYDNRYCESPAAAAAVGVPHRVGQHRGTQPGLRWKPLTAAGRG